MAELIRNSDVYKANALINASYALDTAEQRIILLAILVSRNKNADLTAETIIEIPASLYAQKFNTTVSAAYKTLKEAEDTLFERRFSYTTMRNGKIEVVRSRWVSRVSYVKDDALLTITLAPDVIPLVTKLEGTFTKYAIDNLRDVTSKYGIRLYELVASWKNSDIRKTPVYDFEDFRAKMGLLPHEYRDKKNPESTDMTNFNKRVLKPAIDQINSFTDLFITEKKIKTGRNITGIYFEVSLKTDNFIEGEAKEIHDSKPFSDSAKKTGAPLENIRLPKVSTQEFLGSDLSEEDLNKENPLKEFIVESGVYKSAIEKPVEEKDEFELNGIKRLYEALLKLDEGVTKEYVREYAQIKGVTLQHALIELYNSKRPA
ncbi:TPA: replication initiation protein RepM [Acinetobacter baumannii]|uniref:replication initiation protein RepM n=1 Tax=Acinetobacter baumannii TaxID=470 RepID=UPI002449562E|nr:replication initiation protein RepM [Acinetobacter baumannii]MDH2579846.1 replication initiation protein RepM [Acinetobacter baumannii]